MKAHTNDTMREEIEAVGESERALRRQILEDMEAAGEKAAMRKS